MTHHNGPQDPTQWGGQPPQGGPYPPVPPGPAPQRKNWFARHKIWTGLIALVAVIVVVSIATNGSGSSNPAVSTAPTATQDAATSAGSQPADDTAKAAPASKQPKATKAAAPAKKKSPGIGTPVKSGNLQFTVTKVVRGKASVGQDFMAEKAQGSYTLVYVTVRNVGSDSETLLDSEQKAKDADSKTYSPDSAAELAMKNNNVWLEQINPGNAVDGVLVYDMPVGVKATAIDFSGGLFEDSKTVQLP